MQLFARVNGLLFCAFFLLFLIRSPVQAQPLGEAMNFEFANQLAQSLSANLLQTSPQLINAEQLKNVTKVLAQGILEGMKGGMGAVFSGSRSNLS